MMNQIVPFLIAIFYDSCEGTAQQVTGIMDVLMALVHVAGSVPEGDADDDGDDPVSEVMSKLIKEFQDVTACTDVSTCKRYIEMCNMDLRQACNTYFDAL